MVAMNKIHSNKVRRCVVVLVVLFTLILQTASAKASSASVETKLKLDRTESAKISNIDDWLIGVYTAADSINNIQYNWDWQCAYTSTGTYRVEVISQNGGSKLTLESSAGDQMDYWIYAYVRRGNNYVLSGHTTPVINLNDLSGSQSETCADERFAGTNLWFAALVRPAAFNPAPPGIYRDSVTLMVSPE